MIKKIFITTMILIVIGSLSYSATLAKSMYIQYNDTIKWENSSLLSKIDKVPPSLAKNYITIEEHKLFQLLAEVNSALDEINKEEEIKEEKRSQYLELLNKAESELKENDTYDSLQIKNVFDDFALYLNVDSLITHAYEDYNIDKLEEYSNLLSQRLSKENNKTEKNFLDKLNKISKDYKLVEDFSQKAIVQIGIVKDNILNVNIQVNKETTDTLLKEIEEKDLNKFIHIKKLYDIMKSKTWDTILANNISSSEYYSWKESEEILNSLLKMDYVPVSSFKTVQDVLNYDSSIKLEEKRNFTIDRNSQVTGVYYHGKKLNENLYAKKGVLLNFTIDYKYIENPKSTITIEYVDIDGNKLAVNDEVYQDYVGNSWTTNPKNIEGYVFLEIKNNLNKFPENDSFIQVVYKEYEEPEVIEEPEEVEEPEEPEEVENDVNKNNQENESGDKKD